MTDNELTRDFIKMLLATVEARDKRIAELEAMLGLGKSTLIGDSWWKFPVKAPPITVQTPAPTQDWTTSPYRVDRTPCGDGTVTIARQSGTAIAGDVTLGGQS